MAVKLVVTQGANAGKEIKIAKEQFVIGRGEDCHLRPKSDAISRKHCIIVINPSQVVLRDLGSKNGTYVNDERVEGERVLKSGDNLKIGPLDFQIMIDVGLGNGEKRSRVANVKEAAARTFDSSVVDEDVSAWLGELDEIDRVRKSADPDTRQFKLEETERVTLEETSAKELTGKDLNQTVETDSKAAKFKVPDKKPPGKLPPRAEAETANSRDAAAEMLKKFFNRR